MTEYCGFRFYVLLWTDPTESLCRWLYHKKSQECAAKTPTSNAGVVSSLHGILPTVPVGRVVPSGMCHGTITKWINVNRGMDSHKEHQRGRSIKRYSLHREVVDGCIVHDRRSRYNAADTSVPSGDSYVNLSRASIPKSSAIILFKARHHGNGV